MLMGCRNWRFRADSLTLQRHPTESNQGYSLSETPEKDTDQKLSRTFAGKKGAHNYLQVFDW